MAAAAAAVAAVLAAGVAACGPARADEDAGYEIRVATATTVPLGASSALSVTIAPSGSRTISADGPVRVSVDAPAALGLPRRRYARRDAADPAAEAPRFDVKVKAKEAGDHPVSLDLRFWLCGPRVCRPIATRRTVVVHVPAPAPPPEVDAGVPVDAGAPIDAGRTRRGR